ncbi:HAAS signaling domain-containing protein [Macrococcus armenti]|uniref:HAAS signaling domain-containing protein n=1 Tax=Macrococcus armenti TaxID=2875764 RepID=UPI001CC953FB|nr:DUF1700 domain-containing protein [Macrococcus armenti]UBH15681.1 DUF1700 domain-containing protein [Macrococcus armenti]UBH18042.1 DUF1700 domain-containing protein [Macrococcus armenti]UBH20307.1 DUF1700 domain-containing protein [Macrococcus armenti]
MNRNEFLNTLYNNLSSLNENEKQSILFEYETHFEDGLLDGKSEQLIASELGDPKRIAKELKSTYIVDRAEQNPSTSNVMNAVMATIGLGILNIFFMSVPLFTYISLMFSMIIMAGIFIISPLFLVADYLINGAEAVTLFEVFMTVSMVGAGIILSFAIYYIGKYANKLIVKYAKWNINTVKGA